MIGHVEVGEGSPRLGLAREDLGLRGFPGGQGGLQLSLGFLFQLQVGRPPAHQVALSLKLELLEGVIREPASFVFLTLVDFALGDFLGLLGLDLLLPRLYLERLLILFAGF